MADTATRSRAAKWTQEAPTGAINGSNKNFLLSAVPKPGSLRLELNGLSLMPVDEYTLDGLAITIASAPTGGIPPDVLYAYYQR